MLLINVFQSSKSTPNCPVLSKITNFSENLNNMATWSYSLLVKNRWALAIHDFPLKRRISPVLAFLMNSSSDQRSDFQNLGWIATQVKSCLYPRLDSWCFWRTRSQSKIFSSSYSQIKNSKYLFDPKMSILKDMPIYLF